MPAILSHRRSTSFFRNLPPLRIICFGNSLITQVSNTYYWPKDGSNTMKSRSWEADGNKSPGGKRMWYRRWDTRTPCIPPLPPPPTFTDKTLHLWSLRVKHLLVMISFSHVKAFNRLWEHTNKFLNLRGLAF